MVVHSLTDLQVATTNPLVNATNLMLKVTRRPRGHHDPVSARLGNPWFHLRASRPDIPSFSPSGVPPHGLHLLVTLQAFCLRSTAAGEAQPSIILVGRH